ncbi:MAG: hypothetical protein ACLSWE_21760 [[Clostridium] symbiosum]
MIKELSRIDQTAIRKAVENGHKLVGRSLFNAADVWDRIQRNNGRRQVIADGKEIYHVIIDEEHRKSL